MDLFNILIVEDSLVYSQLLREILQSQYPSMNISMAGDGEEAFIKISQLPPDVIFMDIKLPGENGIELTRKIKSRYPATTVIILTSYDLPEYREKAFQFKADHFLPKGSTNKAQIFSLIESVLLKQKTASDLNPGKEP